MESLPGFDLREYGRLLEALRNSGYALEPVAEMSTPCSKPTVFLRHDLDFSLEAALPMAAFEASIGAKATYYVLLNGPYDVTSAASRTCLKEIQGAGHSLGLHYDLRDYPGVGSEARLREEVAALARLLDAPVHDIAMHEPHRGGEDPFRALSDLMHPHDPRFSEDLLYVSDSCRAWRDESLLRCFLPEPPGRILLLTHPELWQDVRIQEGSEYVERVLLARAGSGARAYFSEEVPRIWAQHPGPLAARRRARGTGPEDAEFLWLSRARVEARLSEFQSLFSRFEEVPWTAEQILRDVPGKWTQSLALERDGDLVGFSFNSIRSGALYVHAFFVDPRHRGQGLGRRMVARLGDRARDLGLDGLELSVHRDNERAQGFYRALGFVDEEQENPEGQRTLRRMEAASCPA
jgi:ribosomal protein S18 acetylase RimI-like enzyme